MPPLPSASANSDSIRNPRVTLTRISPPVLLAPLQIQSVPQIPLALPVFATATSGEPPKLLAMLLGEPPVFFSQPLVLPPMHFPHGRKK